MVGVEYLQIKHYHYLAKLINNNAPAFNVILEKKWGAWGNNKFASE